MPAQISGRRAVFLLAALAAVALVAWRLPRKPALPNTAGGEVLVSAASSLTNAMQAVALAYERAHPGAVVRLNFGASGALQRQIEQGAPVDVFASAGVTEMDALERGGYLAPGTRRDFAGNRLVLIVPAAGRGAVKSWDDLRRPAVHRIAMSDPGSVPSGRYARETLTRRGLWPAALTKLVFGENVRQTLEYVAGGNVDAGVVFATDARIAGGRVHIVSEAEPSQDHAPILYPAAMMSRAPNPAAARHFLAFLTGPEARAILARYGFAAPDSKTGRQ